jgi:alpha-tubulin suppressor-like RCC1 family protein
MRSRYRLMGMCCSHWKRTLRAGPGGSGQGLVYAWGTNYDYQVGNGRRGSVAVPTSAGAD